MADLISWICRRVEGGRTRSLHPCAPRTGEAIAQLRRAVELDTAGTRAPLELGRLYAALDRREEAIAAFEEVLRRDSGVKAAHYRLAQLYRAKGEAEKSREHMRRYQAR